MYDHSKQYRCTIIRGKSQKEMDDFLPAYAKVINEICPCDAEDFEQLFNNAFMRYLPEESRKHLIITEQRYLASYSVCTIFQRAEECMNPREHRNS